MDAHSSGILHTSHLTYIVISCNHMHIHSVYLSLLERTLTNTLPECYFARAYLLRRSV